MEVANSGSSRRYTQYSVWNKDPSAFGKLQFVE